jgi:[acyl-carrier-protein] S-malonyltransferase
MVAVIGLDENILTDVCHQTGTWIVNYNCPGQLVVSGEKDKLPGVADMAKARGAHRVIPLQVSGAFHTPLMQPAVDGMSEIITQLTFRDPAIPVIGNTGARPVDTASSVKEELLRQLCGAIQWQRSVEYMINGGITTFIEIGPGKVLSGLVRRIDRNVKTINLGEMDSINGLAGPASLTFSS